jgi:hypothetical protein
MSRVYRMHYCNIFGMADLTAQRFDTLVIGAGFSGFKLG